MRYENVRSARAEEGLIRLLLRDPAVFRAAPALTGADFSAPVLGKIFDLLRARLDAGEMPQIPALAGDLTGEEMSVLTRIDQAPESAANSRRALSDYIRIIREEKRTRTPGGEFAALAEEIKKQKGYGG